MKRAIVLLVCTLGAGTLSAQNAPRSAREMAPVDLTGYWASVVTEDWAWRMHTPPKGDYASIPLNREGTRVANTWTEDQDGSCKAFGAATMLRVPTRAHITWADDNTLKIETDNGRQTRLMHFGAVEPPTTHTLQGVSRAEWQMVGGRDAPPATGAPLKVVTTGISAAWLRPNGVPVSESAVVTEYFDWFRDGDDQWFIVTTMVDDPTYLTERLVVSSNFRREANGAKWAPKACKN